MSLIRSLTTGAVNTPEGGGALAPAPSGDTTGITDRAALQAALDALPAAGGALRLWPGVYYLGAAGLIANKPTTIFGAGGSLKGDGGLTPVRAVTTLVSTSTTGDCLTIASIGCSVRDLAIVNEAATTPTAGTGIKLTAGSQAHMDRVTVLGFWNLVEISGVYWQINSCHFYDPVNYGLYVNARTPAYYDHADAGVFNSIISMMYRPNDAAAGIRWEAGGGARIIGNKINGGSQPGSTGGRFAYGIDFVASHSQLVDINICNNSIANSTSAAIRMTHVDSTNSVQWVNILGNQINVVWGTGSYGILVTAVSGTLPGAMTNILIAENVLSNLQGLGIVAQYCRDVHIGENIFYATAGPVVRIGDGTLHGSYSRDISVSRQHVNTDNVTLIEDWRDMSSSGDMDSTPVHDYSRTFSANAINVDKMLYKVTLTPNGAVLLRLRINGYGYSTGRQFVIEQVRALTRAVSGAVTATTVGTDTAVGAAAADVTVTYDVSTVTGEVQVKARTTNASFPNVDSRVDISMHGIVQKVRKGT